MKALRNDADERLLVEAAKKDPGRFGELYEIHFERVYAYVARRTGTREAAEDVTSEVFHQALANLGKYEWRGVSFAAWLYRIAANALADRWQRISREQRNPTGDMPGHMDISMKEVEERAMLFRLVETLPADQRRVVELRFAEEKSIREIAAAMKRSEGAVKQLQFRALENLRAQAAKLRGKMSEAHG